MLFKKEPSYPNWVIMTSQREPNNVKPIGFQQYKYPAKFNFIAITFVALELILPPVPGTPKRPI